MYFFQNSRAMVWNSISENPVFILKQQVVCGNMAETTEFFKNSVVSVCFVYLLFIGSAPGA